MNNFGTISSNVGIRVGDTSATFKTIINGYVNLRYERIYKRFNWPTINPTYTFPTVGGTQDYILPIDFKNELYVYDSTNFIDLRGNSLQELERKFGTTLNVAGSVSMYAIYDYMDTSTSPVIKKKIRLYSTPNSILTIALPYQVQQTAMSATTDLPILRCDIACEYGATAEAWRTKRQFAKAADFEGLYEQTIQEMIWEIENNPNKIVQFAPQTYSSQQLY